MPKLSPETIALIRQRAARTFPLLRASAPAQPAAARAAQPMPRGVTIMPATMSAAPSPRGVTIMPATPAARPANVKIQAGPRAAPPNVVITRPQAVPALRELPLVSTAQRQPTELELEGQRVLAEARRLEELEAQKTPAVRLIELAIERVRRPITAAPVLEQWPEGLGFEEIDRVVRERGTAERGQMGVTTGQVIQILQAWRRAHDERTARAPAPDATPAIQPNSASDALGKVTRTFPAGFHRQEHVPAGATVCELVTLPELEDQELERVVLERGDLFELVEVRIDGPAINLAKEADRDELPRAASYITHVNTFRPKLAKSARLEVFARNISTDPQKLNGVALLRVRT